MRVTQKANIRNGDRTNVQVHWLNTIKELLLSSPNTRCLFSRVPQCASNTHSTGNSSFPYLSNEVCANLPRKPIEPGEALVATNTEEDS